MKRRIWIRMGDIALVSPWDLRMAEKERIPEELTIIMPAHNLSGGSVFLQKRWNVKMTNVADHVKCPQCGREARVVWVSQDGKTVAIRCMGYHSHGEIGSSLKGGSRYRTEPKKKYVKGMIFLIEAAKKE